MAEQKDVIRNIDLSFFALECFRALLQEIGRSSGRDAVSRVISDIEHSVARQMATDGMIMGDKHAVRSFINGLRVIERGES